MAAVQLGKGSFEILDLGNVEESDIRRSRIVDQIVLMIILRRVEPLQGIHSGDYRPCIYMGIAQLADIGFGDPLLSVVAVKYRGTVLSADIGALPVELGGIVHDRERDLQYLSVGNLRRVKDDLDRLGMAGGP